MRAFRLFFIFLLLLVSFLSFVSCDKKEELTEEETVLSISYLHAGGEMGYFEELTITKNTIHYYYELRAKGETREINDATPKGLWNSILDKFDLETFAKIESGESIIPLDGLDHVFTIKTKEKEFSVVNGYNEQGEYEQLPDFFKIIMEQVSQYSLDK